jgi:hypothetical protein
MVISPVEPEYFWTRRVMDSDPASAKQILCCQPMRMSMMVNNQEAIYKERRKYLHYQITTEEADTV